MARGGTCQTLIAYPSSPTPVHLLQLAAQRNVAQLSLVGHRTLRTAPAAFSDDDDCPHVGTRGRHVLSLKGGGGERVRGWKGSSLKGAGAEIKQEAAVGAEPMRGGGGQQRGLISPSWSAEPASAR